MNIKKLFIYSLACGIIFWGCGVKKKNIVNQACEIQSKAIFERNDLSLEFKNKEELLNQYASSVGAMVSHQLIGYEYDESGVSKEGLKIQTQSVEQQMNICPGSAMGQDPYLARCSGFLVAGNQVLTAGHCFKDQKINKEYYCRNFGWLFGHQNNNQSFRKSDLYSCKKVIVKYDESKNIDYAIVTLNEFVTGAIPLPLDSDGDFSQNTNVAMLSFPLGGRLRSSGLAALKVKSFNNLLESNLDSLPGSSGAPVIDLETGLVIGIHMAGEAQYMTKQSGETCQRLRVCQAEEDCTHATAFQISEIDELLNKNKCN